MTKGRSVKEKSATTDEAPIRSEDIKEYLNTHDDFGLELLVFRVCKEFRLGVSHGGTYEDPVTKKSRQFDLRAWMDSNPMDDRRRRVQMPVECKSLKPDYPLVVLRVPRQADEDYSEILIHQEMPNIASYSAKSIRSLGSYYQRGSPVGKSMAQIGRSNSKLTSGRDGEVYDKWSQSVSSAHDLLVSAASARLDRGSRCTITLPTLVVSNDTLWVVDYDEGGRPSEPKQIDECPFYIGKRFDVEYRSPISGTLSLSHTLSHLHIFTLNGFVEHLKGLKADHPIWDRMFPIDLIR
jgi:hypothetical protein